MALKSNLFLYFNKLKEVCKVSMLKIDINPLYYSRAQCRVHKFERSL